MSFRPFYLAPFGVLILALLATYGSWLLLERSEQARADLRFQQEVELTQDAIEERLNVYDVVLKSASALFHASQGVTREEFSRFFNELSPLDYYEGMLGLGFARYLQSDQLDAYEAEIRQEGGENFNIRPRSDGDDHIIVTYIEPTTDRNLPSLGFDGLSLPGTRPAVDLTMRTGQTAISAPQGLREGLPVSENPGVLMFQAVPNRAVDSGNGGTAAGGTYGFVYLIFRVGELFENISRQQPDLVSFAVFDPDAPSQVLFNNLDNAATDSPRTARTQIVFGGRTWILEFAQASGFDDATRTAAPLAALVVGALVSVVLFVITFQMYRIQRARSEAAEALLAAEKKLFQAQKMESLGQLTGGIAHDFNNLLQIMESSIDLIMEDLGPGHPMRRLAEGAQRAARRGAELTSRLLAFSRRQPLQPIAVNVDRLIEEMNALLLRTLGGQVTVRTVSTPGLWLAMVDPTQLETAILNLCINSRDAMPTGGLLTIETENVTIADSQHDGLPAGDYVKVAVTDTGTGMDEATRNLAFEPFFTTKDVGRGSGLGLSMVFGFVSQSEGHVAIDSTPGLGTTVSMYLPRAHTGDEADRPADKETSLPRGEERVLLVEDDEFVRQSVAQQLQSLGYHVVSASNGDDALTMLQSGIEVDLLLTDCVMPGGLNGRQLAERTRAMRPGLPIILSSGHEDGAPENSDLPMLRKPYSRPQLATTLRRVLDGSA